MDPPKTYTTDSFKDIKHKDTRLIRLLVLENYVAMYNKNPTEQEYWAYNSDWWNKKAKMKCKICDSIIIRDFLKRHRATKKCQAAERAFQSECLD
jgi:hypothetical protein